MTATETTETVTCRYCRRDFETEVIDGQIQATDGAGLICCETCYDDSTGYGVEPMSDNDISIALGVGHAGVGWTDEQLDRIAGIYRQYETDTPAPERFALLTAAAQAVDGTLDRDEIKDADLRAQLAAQDARSALRMALRVEVANGLSEVQAARSYGVDRMTVRSWLGKR